LRNIYCVICIAATAAAATLCAQTDWPSYGRDPGAQRYSPLKQINTKNVDKLELAWSLDTQAQVTQAPLPGPPRAGAAGRGPRPRRSSTTPLVIDGVMYMSTAYNRVLALEPETGKKLWEYESTHTPGMRGIAFWGGSKDLPPQVIVGTNDGYLIALNAKTGKPVPGFGNEGLLNLRTGMVEKFPNAQYGLSSPPAIYKDLIITGSHTQESPSFGPLATFAPGT
jgi:quinoprotein glucose dehydrogenase